MKKSYVSFSLTRCLTMLMALVLFATAAIVPVSAADHSLKQVDLNATYGKEVTLAVRGECDYAMAYEVLTLVNAERKKAGKSTLAMDKAMMEAAMLRATECSLYYAHTRPNGEECFSAFPTFNGAGENVAAGYTSAADVMDGWMDSPGHKANILDADFKSIGIGVFKIGDVYYWSQLFNSKVKQSTPTEKKAVTKTIAITARTKLLDLHINKTKLTLDAGETATLSVINRNINFPYVDHPIHYSGLSFETAKSEVVTVSSSGVVTPVGKGSTTITVKSKNGVKLFTVSVTSKCQDVHTHKYTAATCTAPKTCKGCGATSGKKLGHTYSNACDKSCNRCKATRTVSGHQYKTVITKKATTTTNGKRSHVCTQCGYTSSKTSTTYKASKISLSKTTYTYNGKAQKPTVTVKDYKGNKISSSYYTVSYASGRKNVGTYKVTVKFKGRYSGTKTLTIKINPSKTSISKLTGAKKSLKVSIAKKSTQVTGYQIQYSTSKSFKSYKTKTISSYKTTSATLTGLSAKKTYYVRVRTYKTVAGKKYYSGWSTIKSIKTK